MEEKRLQPRRFLRVDLDLVEGDHILPVYSRDVSQGGIFVETPHPLPQGTEVFLRFNSPGRSEPIKIRGCVVDSSRKSGMGIKFLNLVDEALDLFENLENFEGRES
ncbi:MAG: PilZ domain-containing protein [Deltaproteobacteria bacterium]|nr:PilZ domain-containing protein [Deltaproteobacteria bacterium]